MDTKNIRNKCNRQVGSAPLNDGFGRNDSRGIFGLKSADEKRLLAQRRSAIFGGWSYGNGRLTISTVFEFFVVDVTFSHMTALRETGGQNNAEEETKGKPAQEQKHCHQDEIPLAE